MSDTCPVCGRGYRYGPGAPSHRECHDRMVGRGVVDEAVAWLMADDLTTRGPEPELVRRLRAEIQNGPLA